MNHYRRSGTTLLVVLMTISMLSAVALAGRTTAALSVRMIQNRHAVAGAEYVADGCLVHWVSSIEVGLRGARTEAEADSLWSALKGPGTRGMTLCTLDARAAGETIDVNSASDELIRLALSSVAPGHEEA